MCETFNRRSVRHDVLAWSKEDKKPESQPLSTSRGNKSTVQNEAVDSCRWIRDELSLNACAVGWRDGMGDVYNALMQKYYSILY
jgi:hypothetical protein